MHTLLDIEHKKVNRVDKTNHNGKHIVVLSENDDPNKLRGYSCDLILLPKNYKLKYPNGMSIIEPCLFRNGEKFGEIKYY